MRADFTDAEADFDALRAALDQVQRRTTAVPVSGPSMSNTARALQIYRARRGRDILFGEPSIFGEPAYDMLLDLYVAAMGDRKVSVSSAAIASAVPATTALRHIDELCARGLILRVDDETDGRRVLVSLTPKALEAMDLHLSSMRV